MSRSQWNVLISGAMTASYSSPGLSGTAMLQVDATNEGTSFADITVTPASGLPHGVPAGMLRCLFTVTGSWGSGYADNLFGVFCLGDNDTPMGGVYAGYGVLVEYNRISLRKSTLSTPLSGAPVIAQHPQGYVTGVLIALEVQWEAQAPTKTVFTVRRGTRSDYANLTTILTYEDTTSPILTGAWEGVTVRQTTAAAGVLLRAQVDKTTLYTQSV